MALPVEFENKMKLMLGKEWDDFLSSYDNNRYQALRFNTLKKGIDVSKYSEYLKNADIDEAEEVSWAKNAFYYGEESRPGKHPYHEAGLYYIQEPSAMSPAALLAPEPGMRVLDLCAAPGGKSTQLASYLDGTGLLISNEINSARSRILSSNIERMGAVNVIVTNEDSSKLATKFPSYFHAIQVDAPCSGEGMFRKLPEAMEQWSLQQVLVCASRQLEILDNAAVMLMPGGRIVYSTCTFSREENEDVIEEFLRKHPEFSVGKMERFWPHIQKGEGHFVAELFKTGKLPAYEIQSNLKDNNSKNKNSNNKNSKNINSKKDKTVKLTKEQMKQLDEFLDTAVSSEIKEWILLGELKLFKDQLYRLPDNAPALDGIRVLRAGLHIGEYRKNRFEPAFALALSLGMDDVKSKINMAYDDIRVKAYYRGESVMLNDEDADKNIKGWTLLCIDGFSAGWCKANGCQLKNHYPKGLRKEL